MRLFDLGKQLNQQRTFIKVTLCALEELLYWLLGQGLKAFVQAQLRL